MNNKVVSLAGKRAAAVPEGEFLRLIDKDFEAAPERVQPIPASIFKRFDALKQRIQATLDEQLQEG